MTNILRKIALCAVCLIVAAKAATGKEWRGIVPLKSTRTEIERVFGAPKYTSYSGAYYSLAKEIVVFDYQTTPCKEDQLGLGWNVPVGTVVGIGVIPKGNHRKQEYPLSTDSKISDHGGGFTYYYDDAAGFSLETYKDRVTLVEYYPEAARNNLKCPKTQNCCIDSFPRFDEYGQLSFSDEKARLDNYLFQLNSLVARGTIEIAAPSMSARRQQMKAAARARKYLIKHHGVEPERILILDGGYSESTLTRLNIYSIGGFGSMIYLYRLEDPATTSRKP